MSMKTSWKARLTDKLRDMIPGAIALTVASSIWLIGQARDSEADTLDAYGAPVILPAMVDEGEEFGWSWDGSSADEFIENSESEVVPLPAHAAITSASE